MAIGLVHVGSWPTLIFALLHLHVALCRANLSSHLEKSGCASSEWVDPSTPPAACRKTDYLGRDLELVFSDEFEVAGRTFRDGDDSRWTAINGFPDGNEQINAYDDSPQFARTADGLLKLKVDAQSTILNYTDWSTGESRSSQKRSYTTPMLQTWNKFCFAGGRIELSAQLPGKAEQPGIWPAFWLMGNLGRATVTASTENMWPYSYDHCPSADQSRANQYVEQNQMINKCREKAWTDQYGLNPHQGRGAIEIDIIEAMPGTYTYDYEKEQVASGHCPPLKNQAEYDYLRVRQPMVATSLQLAPGIFYKADQRPKDADAGHPRNCLPEDWSRQWYAELQPGNVNAETYGSDYHSSVNIDFWGDYFDSDIPWQTDSLSARHELPKSAFETQNVYTLEWFSGKDGYVRFTLNDKLQYHIDGSTVERNIPVSADGNPIGDLLGRQIPVEPSYIMLNIDLSPRWGFPYCPPDKCDCCYDCRNPACTTCVVDGYNYMGWLSDLCATLPASYDIDWVRVYQHPGASNTGCSTKAFPSEGWIESHRENFTVPNMDEPLRPMLAGGARCTISAAADCGHHRGACVNGTCRCSRGWTGPRCLSTQVGSSAICRPLEETAIGGAPCVANSPDECGAQQGAGTCVWVWRPWERPTQELVLPDGSLQLAGGGDGRCSCASGWGGTHCNKPRPSTSACVPDASLPSTDLEALLEALCDQVKSEHVSKVCRAVQWKAHWQSGGEQASCGSWLRSSAVLRAVNEETGMCCSKVHPTSKQLQCTADGSLPVSSEQCFLRADYGNAAAAVGVCPWPYIQGLYAPQLVVDDVVSQDWFPKGSSAEVATVKSALECQSHCQQSANCSFFTYDRTSESCWLKSAVDCALDSAFTLSFNLISGPRKDCITPSFLAKLQNTSTTTSTLPPMTSAPASTSIAMPAGRQIESVTSDEGNMEMPLVGAGAGVLVIALALVCLCCARRRLRSRNLEASSDENPSKSKGASARTPVTTPRLLASASGQDLESGKVSRSKSGKILRSLSGKLSKLSSRSRSGFESLDEQDVDEGIANDGSEVPSFHHEALMALQAAAAAEAAERGEKQHEQIGQRPA